MCGEEPFRTRRQTKHRLEEIVGTLWEAGALPSAGGELAVALQSLEASERPLSPQAARLLFEFQNPLMPIALMRV